MKKNKDIDAYIAGFPKSTEKLLKQMRSAIRKAAPAAEEIMSYGMPAYKYQGMVAYFAGHANHVGLYPMPHAVKRFEKELRPYTTAKSTVRFPIGKALPVGLITRMIKLRVKENLEKTKVKKLPK